MSLYDRIWEFIGLTLYMIDFEDPEVIKRKHQVIVSEAELLRQKRVMKWVRVSRMMYIAFIVLLASYVIIRG